MGPVAMLTCVSIGSLHPNQQRILAALRSAVRILRMPDHLTIVGSLAAFLAGEKSSAGDIDVLIDAELCKRYWEFTEILSLHGIKSVYDVLARPEFPWHPCCDDIAHATALTVDCREHEEHKHANLDICISANDLGSIPNSSDWVYMLKPKDLVHCDEATRANRISEGHRTLIDELRRKHRALEQPRFAADLGLRYALVTPT
jgi:hypothetical protein